MLQKDAATQMQLSADATSAVERRLGETASSTASKLLEQRRHFVESGSKLQAEAADRHNKMLEAVAAASLRSEAVSTRLERQWVDAADQRVGLAKQLQAVAEVQAAAEDGVARFIHELAAGLEVRRASADAELAALGRHLMAQADSQAENLVEDRRLQRQAEMSLAASLGKLDSSVARRCTAIDRQRQTLEEQLQLLATARRSKTIELGMAAVADRIKAESPPVSLPVGLSAYSHSGSDPAAHLAFPGSPGLLSQASSCNISWSPEPTQRTSGGWG